MVISVNELSDRKDHRGSKTLEVEGPTPLRRFTHQWLAED
jgi:hypothetical protein